LLFPSDQPTIRLMEKTPPFTADSVPDLKGKTALVTGANSGLGYELALVLARRNARVIFASRDPGKGQKAVEALKQLVPGAEIDLRVLDLSDLESVCSFCEGVVASYKSLDFLFNNAGVMALPYRQTKQGFEMQLGTNHLGHFALTGRLLPLWKAAPAARLITTSSIVHKMGRINFDNLDGQKGYNPWTAYAQSKLANLLFAYELDRKLKASGSSALSLASHPGMSYTNLVSVGPEMKGAVLEKNVSSFFVKLVAQTAAQGTLPGLYAAVTTELKGGEYVGPDGWLEMKGYPVVVSSSKRSYEEDAAHRLWEVSEQRTGLSF